MNSLFQPSKGSSETVAFNADTNKKRGVFCLTAPSSQVMPVQKSWLDNPRGDSRITAPYSILFDFDLVPLVKPKERDK